MPELPDVTVYIERLDAFLTGRTIEDVRVIGPSFVKSFDPPVRSIVGLREADAPSMLVDRERKLLPDPGTRLPGLVHDLCSMSSPAATK